MGVIWYRLVLFVNVCVVCVGIGRVCEVMLPENWDATVGAGVGFLGLAAFLVAAAHLDEIMGRYC